MAYERYGTRDPSRDEHTRWRDERSEPRGSREERGFFERAGDEVASWFGDEEAERRRREDLRMADRDRGTGRESDRSWRSEDHGVGRFRSQDDERERFSGSGREWYRGPNWRDERSSRGSGRDFDREHERGQSPMNRDRGYRPMEGDYGRGSEPTFARAGHGREDQDRFRGQREYDPHYRSWRERHMSDLDRDYAEYRREEQARFEREFGGWRERRLQKRRMLDDIREHMEVVGSDDQHIGTIDRVSGDRIVLTRSDPESGGVHHSLSCADIARVEGDRVILDLSANDARARWRDESRERALFERQDRGEMGPRALGRSFEGTYR